MKHEMKGRKHRSTGGVNEDLMDLDDKPERRVNAKKINDEAEERKRGGGIKKEGFGPEGQPTRAKRKRGGKLVGEVHGEHARHHAGRRPRKAGGSCDSNPFSSARKGEVPKGRSVDLEMENE